MDILTQGRTIFRALNLLQEKEYHEALVEFLPDSDELPHQPASNQEEAELLSLFQECHALIYGQLWVTSDIESPWPLSFHMGARLPLELEEKQALLEMRGARSPHFPHRTPEGHASPPRPPAASAAQRGRQRPPAELTLRKESIPAASLPL